MVQEDKVTTMTLKFFKFFNSSGKFDMKKANESPSDRKNTMFGRAVIALQSAPSNGTAIGQVSSMEEVLRIGSSNESDNQTS